MTAYSCCAVIPVYNHEDALRATVEEVLAYLPVILVDDGCNEKCKQVIRDLAQGNERIILVTHAANRGKGAAVKSGMRAALKAGYSHALQIDADGQHEPKDISRFISYSQKQPAALIAGQPDYDDSIPRGRHYGRYLTHIWIWINTLSFTIKDSMCGFRVYPLKQSVSLLDSCRMGDRMDFDPEFIVRWYWAGHEIVQLRTPVTYPADGVSHFLPWRDNKLISLMHAKLFFGMLLRLPRLLMHKRP